VKKTPCSLLVPVLLAALAAAAAVAAPVGAPADSVAGAWGLRPARADSVTALPRPQRPAAWQTALRVPYHIVGVPLTMVDKAGKGLILGLERLGAFRATEQVVRGVPDPLGNFWLPDVAYGDAQGWQFGLIGQRPHFPLPRMRTKLRAGLSTTEASAWSLGSLAPLGRHSWIEVGGGSLVLSRTDYYGTGVGTSEDDRSHYRRDSDWFGAGWRQAWANHLEFVVLGHYSVQRARQSSHDDGRALEDIFAADLPYGYDLASSGLTGGLQLGLDDTDETGRPDRGLRLFAFTQYFEPTDGSATRYWTSGVSAERYLNLGRPQRTLALKGWWLRERTLEDGPIPFTRLLRNRVPYQLRAYSSARFHSQGTVGFSAEYRWPVWTQNRPEGAGLDAYLFGDTGQPYERSAEIALHNLLWSAGFGLRVVNARTDFTLRIELAMGEEGLQARLSTQQIYQFIKAGFYDGSEPVPVLR
jgi:hypothetical protein